MSEVVIAHAKFWDVVYSLEDHELDFWILVWWHKNGTFQRTSLGERH